MSEFERLVDEFFAFWWHASPSAATAVGIHTHDRELERYDPDSLAERSRRYREYVEAFERSAPQGTGEELDRMLIVDQLRWELFELEEARTLWRNPVYYLEIPLNALYLMSVRDYAPAQERALRVADRLAAFPRVLEESRENLIDAAPIFVRTAIEVARSGLELIDRVLPLYLGRALEDDASQFARWENALRGAASALVGYVRWLEEDLAPRATSDFALGRESFERKVRYAHGLSYTADELAAYGLALKQETEQRLESLAVELNGHGDWRAFAETLKEEHPPAGELIQAYADAVAEARDFVLERGLASLQAGEALEVTATPDYLRPLIPYAAYQAPAAHESEQRGFFYVTPPPPGLEAEVLRDHSVYGIHVTALHEAYPGHHLQLTRANRADSEPRRVFWTPVFAEGWALYCEELMWEQGFYRDPRQRLLQLKDLLWRACRVVADVGLHARGWTPEQTVEYMVREAGLERHNAEIEVRRYCTESTQPLSYAVGKREIMRIRERYRIRMGDAFDLGEFHDRLLSWGTIPPPLISRAMGL